jgi:hypothetical protein
MKTWGNGDVTPPFLTSALDGGEWSDSRPCLFAPGEIAPGSHWIRRLGGPQSRSGRCGEEKNLALPGIELDDGVIFFISDSKTSKHLLVFKCSLWLPPVLRQSLRQFHPLSHLFKMSWSTNAMTCRILSRCPFSFHGTRGLQSSSWQSTPKQKFIGVSSGDLGGHGASSHFQSIAVGRLNWGTASDLFSSGVGSHLTGKSHVDI